MKATELKVGEFYARVQDRRFHGGREWGTSATKVCLVIPYVKHEYARDPHEDASYRARWNERKTGALIGRERVNHYGEDRKPYWTPMIVPLGQLICTWKEWESRVKASEKNQADQAKAQEAEEAKRQREYKEIIAPMLKAAGLGDRSYYFGKLELYHGDALKLCQYIKDLEDDLDSWKYSKEGER